MMGPNDPTSPTGLPDATSWEAQWAMVPPAWRRPVYRVGEAPANEVFQHCSRYLAENGARREHDFSPHGAPRLGHEVAWWVFTCWREGLRQIHPSILNWLKDAIALAAKTAPRPIGSVLDLSPGEVVRSAMLLFERRNGRLPSPGRRSNITALAEHLHLMLSVRCCERSWWSHDVWDLRADPRIPRREHEPSLHVNLVLTGTEPRWLREGLRFYLRAALSFELLSWTSAVLRAGNLAAHLGRFCQARSLADPLMAQSPEALRLVFLDFLDHLRSPTASAKGGPLSRNRIRTVQSQTQSFYTFMFDHAAEAAAATGEPRWRDITVGHTRLWAPSHRTRANHGERELTWHSTSDLKRMLALLDVLAAEKTEQVVITHPDGTISVAAGLGDPTAARVWLLQALTGRRASEILMLDRDPLEAIPGAPAGEDAAFVAKLRYQQTKVDGVIPTIMVEQAVVDVVREQQRWLEEHCPGEPRKYLFPNPHRLRADNPRAYDSYNAALTRLDGAHGLKDSLGRPLRFTHTHRLRHTRATELLNDGVPFHVVQRYLGHKSPEMTARYAATLAATAEAEFLKHKKIGAHGTDIGISPKDVYEMTQLGKHTDRVLPNGVCLLPPLKACDKGNACLSCGHFATDRTHLEELRAQRQATTLLIDQRRARHLERTGHELSDQNVWAAERLREIASLDAIIAKLEADVPDGSSVAGAATKNRLPLLQIQTRGAHETAIAHASRDRQPGDD